MTLKSPHKIISAGLIFLITVNSCGKKSSGPVTPPAPRAVNFIISSWDINGQVSQTITYDVNKSPVIKLIFPAAIDKNTTSTGITLAENAGIPVNYTASYQKGDSIVIIQPTVALSNLTKYKVTLSTQLKSTNGGIHFSPRELLFLSSIDSTAKFPAISDEELLTKVQQQTFNYFWRLSHPVSGMARERNTDANIYTTGGTGFGIMAIVTAIHRNFITRAEGLARLQSTVSFLKNTSETFHGAYPHWLNGQTGKVIPFSSKDNGADLVETSYLIQGLLTARQYFNSADAGETNLRNDINTIADRVEWDWFRQNNQNTLYWHWSPNFNWEMNHQVKGWNECLITYVLAASSTTHPVPNIVYDNGWASNGGMKNGNTYYGYQLPLGPQLGGPLFFSHYSFLGIKPTGLSDPYANYQTQTLNHSKINYEYCRANPLGHFGYSNLCWGLSASDIKNGYTASSPTNDVGVIAPTAALSSFPYTPSESMQALKFFYYTLGDKIWKEYGFVDAFALKDTWFANSFLAIDQGPIIVMIENYRSGLLWNLFTSCPEVKTGMLSLGFSAPYL